MRIIAHVIVRNEMNRYLEQVLQNLDSIVDLVHIVDDRSDDGTYEWLMDDYRFLTRQRVLVERRDPQVPSFVEDEKEFRQWAWWMAGQHTEPGDWMLAIDADEIFTVGDQRPLTGLREQLDVAIMKRRTAPCLRFRVHEVFGFSDTGVPLIRTDGAWGGIGARRLARQAGYIDFARPATGRRRTIVPSDSLPWQYGPGAPMDEFVILHFGYATDADRKMKSERYAADRRHTRSHVNSILTRPRLHPWRGPVL